MNNLELTLVVVVLVWFSSQVHGIESGLSGIQLSLQKLEEKSGNGGAVQGDAMNFGATLEEQNRALSRVASLLEETSMKVKDLPE